MKTDTDSTNRNPACTDPDHMGPAIHVEKLTKSYHGTTALHGLSLDVMRGEAFGLLGANGAGKSTAIECILGTRKPDSGTVSVLPGHEPEGAVPKGRRPVPGIQLS